MPETSVVASRGRSAAARGRSSGPGRHSTRHANGDHKPASDLDAIADQGELGEIKRKYKDELVILKEMFTDWTDLDLVFALSETQGDIALAIERITEGSFLVFFFCFRGTFLPTIWPLCANVCSFANWIPPCDLRSASIPASFLILNV